IPAPEFPTGTGQVPNGVIKYAPGPYGVSRGSIIANYNFVGYPNYLGAADLLDTGPACTTSADCHDGLVCNTETSACQMGLWTIHLAAFYTPTGTDVFPENPPYGAGQPKPKALLIDVASVWCGPCNDEAKFVLPGQYALYQPQGGEFLLQLADSQTP